MLCNSKCLKKQLTHFGCNTILKTPGMCHKHSVVKWLNKLWDSLTKQINSIKNILIKCSNKQSNLNQNMQVKEFQKMRLLNY